MGLIQATKETGPLYYAAVEKDEVKAVGMTNPGEITISGMELISDAKEPKFIGKVAEVLKTTQAEAETAIRACKEELTSHWPIWKQGGGLGYGEAGMEGKTP